MKNSQGIKEKGTILVPVDYSNYSTLASRYAAKIASKSGSKLCFFHSFYSPAFDLIELTGGISTQQQLRTDVTEKLFESEEADIKEFVNNLLEYKELASLEPSRISYQIKPGLAKDEIIRMAGELRAEMVVMGTRGSDKKNTSILGSITESTIKKLNIPVIAIPEDYKFKGEENLKKLVYLTDFDESDFVSITKLMRFTSLFNMSIHCVHIGDSDAKWENLKMQGLKDYFQKVYQEDSVECDMLNKKSDLLQTLDEYVQENSINLIALTHKKRKLLGKVFKTSLTKKIFYHTEVPLMVFHS